MKFRSSKIFLGVLSSIFLFSAAPFIVHAQRVQNIRDIIVGSGRIVNILISIVIALAVLFFLWGLTKFVFHVGGDEGAREEGKKIMLWGVIALFVMVSIWGLVNFLSEAFFGSGGYGPTAPIDYYDQQTRPQPLLPLESTPWDF